MIWLIGSKGMLGTEAAVLLEKSGLPFTGTDREVDITNPAALEAFAGKRDRPFKWIINCAAYTAVDRAEEDIERCRRLNAGGPANIARYAGGIGAKLIHLSTDYVFDGTGNADGGTGVRPYREDDATNPIGVYGLTKREGEVAVMENNPHSYIIRTAWLYGAHGANFVTKMLALMNERDAVAVVDDQRGSPTWAGDLAAAIIALIQTVDTGGGVPCGIYHYTNEGDVSWYAFAGEIFKRGRRLGLVGRDCAVTPCKSAEYPAKVRRPEYTVLDTGKIRRALGIAIPAWEASLGEFLSGCAR